MELSCNKTFLKKVSDILTIQIKNQITRLSDNNTDSSIKRKRPFDDITNTDTPVVEASGAESQGMDDTFILKEIDLLLGYTLILKQWYLGILQKSGKNSAEEEYLACKVIKKGVSDAEQQSLRILDYVESHTLKKLELSSSLTSQGKKDDLFQQKKRTLDTIDMIYNIKIKHMMKEIITIYTEFYDIAVKLCRGK
ncbi:hypothetical protein [Absidia glauca]|uniref:Proteasome activator PA28 C-terminal domain-containing protein n=1 Tax=Absidia glauca TaxID=4829 RepID=A0A168NB57_ABSGL|nr:hypothetical protein [Absidia glauca]